MAASRNSSTYRPEIQGIRTIGALLVACFHIWGGRVSGGVDVFFVISGFLITGSLYKEVRANRTINVAAFWGGIAKRVAPMAYVVLALTFAAAVLWMPKSRLDGFLSEVFYSAFHLENIKLMMNSVDYLARDEASSPVQQFWALSVQVQFYAVWPFMLMAMAFMARKLRAGKALYLAVLASVFLASLSYSIVVTVQDPTPAYFNTLARMWEFALGGILSIALPHLVLSSNLRWLAGWIGLLLVVSCGFVFPASAHFPGYIALWPTLGAALVLISGNCRLRYGADRLLASKPLVMLGDISFSFYLWHWPVLIFFLIVKDRTEVGLVGGLGIIVLSLCGAYPSSRSIEQPIQRSSVGQRRSWHVHLMATGFAVPVIVIAAGWVFLLGPMESNENLSAADYPGGSIPASMETMMKPGVPLMPKLAAAKRDFAKVLLKDCHQSSSDAAVIECPFGKLDDPTKTVAIVGGSHSSHWFPALEILAERYGWRIVNITKSACPLAVGDGLSPSCLKWNKNVIASLSKSKPDVVFTTSTRRQRVSGRKREYIPEGYQKQWPHLGEIGVRVIAVRDNPWLGFNTPECLEANSSNIMACSRTRSDVLNDADPATTLPSKPGNVDFIDMTDRFCDQSTCFPVSGNMVIYSDMHHITVTFARTLATTLGERMRQVRPDLFPADALEKADKWQSTEAGQ